ncbi:MAG: universal stress protein [Gammaproteobacteria bacterium]|jgi:nucleotide-binding universal stress UspA family protein
MYSHILIPVDGSPTSDRALIEAARLASLCDARLRILHVVDPITHMTGFERPEVYVRDILPQLIAGGEQVLEKARQAALAEAPGLAIDTELQEGQGQRTWEIILDRARASAADLLVLGTHGRRGFNRVLMGSDAEQVVRHATVPVLLVRPPAD